ncbi:GntR family transcriptional regulator [Roseivivax sp.]
MPRIAIRPDLSPHFRPVDRGEPAAPQIAAALREAILTMDVAPGQPLTESHLGEVFGASRTPVRDALSELQAERLIVRLPNRGTLVAPLSRSDILDAQFIREALELANIRSLIDGGLPEASRARLEEILEAQGAAVDAVDWQRFSRLDNAFHLELAQTTGRERAAELLQGERARLDRLRYGRQRLRHELEPLFADHRAVIDAIVARDSATAEERMRQHLRVVLGTLDEMAAENAELFAD